jgi:uncharacterized protein (DUF3820 family)
MELYIEIFVGTLLILSLFLKSNSIIKFGKHKGNKYTDLSDDYLLWLSLNTNGISKKQAIKELIKRKSMTKEDLAKNTPTLNNLLSNSKSIVKEDLEKDTSTENNPLTNGKSIIKEDLAKNTSTEIILGDNVSYSDDFEKIVANTYERKGYKVKYNRLELGHRDSGIDLIAKKNNKTVLIQCEFWTKEDSITHKMVKEFYGNCNFYIDKQKLDRKNTICLYALQSHKSISKKDGADKIIEDNHKKCRYKVFE